MMTVSKPPTEKTKKIDGRTPVTLADEDLEPYEGYYCHDLRYFVTKFDVVYMPAVALFWRPRG